MVVPHDGVEWHDNSRQQRIYRISCHTVAARARSACHSVAASGTRGRQRKSVHKLARMAPRCHFGAFVYTVALLWTDVGTQECTQMGGSGLSAPFWGVCVHCCDASRDTNRDASCARWHERLSHHGVPAAPPRWPLPLGREDRLCASGAAARLASSPRRQPTRTPEEHKKNGPTHYGVGPRTSLVDRQGFEPWTLGLRVPCSTS